MLTTVFIGSRNGFDQMLVRWLAQHSDLRGVVWTRSTAWGRTWRGRWGFARRRWRRRGLLKMLDELAFYVYQRTAHGPSTRTKMQRLVATARTSVGSVPCTWDEISTDDVNSAEVVAFLESRQPDVAFAVCINEYFGGALRSIPRHGVLLWHEGFTPEYRGLYSPFWTVHNLDFERLGYTLLRMNDALDGGEILAQGRVLDVDPRRDEGPYIGHKAIYDSLPAVARLLQDLERGVAKPLARTGAQARYYTYPGLSDYIRQQWRLRRRASVPPSTTMRSTAH